MKKLLSLSFCIITCITIEAQNVGIGTITPLARLDVNSPSESFTAKFNGATSMYLGFFENNNFRGYLGSFSGAAEDFDIGTSSLNPTGKLHLTIRTNPRMTIDNTGNVGIGTTAPASSSILELNSTAQGFLTPRMTTAQRNAISAPVKGLLVYDTDANDLYHFNGSVWTTVGFSLPYTGSFNTVGNVLNITNTGSGDAISGTAQGTSAIGIGGYAQQTGSYGVYGNNNSSGGFGVGGASASGTAVYGFSAGAGTALRGVSTTGYGLLTSGNLRFTGGNTNPSAGAVLTSTDGSGNAVWKTNSVGFNARVAENVAIPSNEYRKIEFSNETFDAQNNFVPYAGATTTNSSTFTAPVSGFYHFSSHFEITLISATNNFTTGGIALVVNGTRVYTRFTTPEVSSSSSTIHLSLSTGVFLNSGDKVWIECLQINDDDIPEGPGGNWAERSSFSGHLVFAN